MHIQELKYALGYTSWPSKDQNPHDMSFSPIPITHAQKVNPKKSRVGNGKKRGDFPKDYSKASMTNQEDSSVYIKSEPLDDRYDRSVRGTVKEDHTLHHQAVYTPDSDSQHSTPLALCVSKECRRDSINLHSIGSSLSPPSTASSSADTPPGVFTSSGASSKTEDLSEHQQEQPDSSTAAFEQLTPKDGRRQSMPSISLPDSLSTSHHSATSSTARGEVVLCQVCGDLAAGFYCGAYICEACKKFFIRASKLERPKYVCLRQKNCVITKESRVHCQYCRYQKCLQLDMYYPKNGQKNVNKIGVQEIPCRVCSAPSSGFHFGALTCEGCKGFFRRMVKEREACAYKCSKNGSCGVNAMTRNMCKACRYNKCLQIGMSIEGSRIGRQPNSVKHAISLEATKQVTLKSEVSTEEKREGSLDSSSAGFSFDSVVLQPCVPGEVDDSLQPIDINQDSSIDLFDNSPARNEDVQIKQECPESRSQDEQSQDVPGPKRTQPESWQPMPEIFRTPSRTSLASGEHRRHIQDTETQSSHLSYLSFRNSGNVPYDLHHDSYSQPEDLSESSGPNSVSSSRSSSQLSRSLPRPLLVPSPHTISPLPSSSPVYISSSSSCDPGNYGSQPDLSTHKLFYRSSSFDDDLYRRAEYEERKYYRDYYPSNREESRQDYFRDVRNDYDTGHMIQQERFINQRDCPSPRPHVPTNQYSASFPSHNRQQSPFQEQDRPMHLHRHSTERPYQSPIEFLGQHSRESGYNYPSSHKEYEQSHLKSEDTSSTGCQNLGYYSDRSDDFESSQSHTVDYKEESQLWADLSQYQPSDLTTHSRCSKSKTNPVNSSQNDPTKLSSSQPDRSRASSPAPASKKLTLAGDLDIRALASNELEEIILEAAKNLTHMVVLQRAKSDMYEPEKYETVDLAWEKLMEHFNFHARCIVRFAKRIPGFRRLNIDDQVLLLRMATYSLVILNHSRAYEPETGFHNFFNFSHREIDRITELFPEFDVLHTHYKNIGIMVKRHHLIDLEYAYLSCMLLLNDEFPGLSEVNRVKELKEKLMEAFQCYEMTHFQNGGLRFGEMLLRLSEFSEISMQHNVAVGLVITKYPQLHIPQLYAEMYVTN